MTPLGSLIHDTNGQIGHLQYLKDTLRGNKEIDRQYEADRLEKIIKKLKETIDKYYQIRKEAGDKMF